MTTPPAPPVDLGIPGVEDPVEVGAGGFATVYRASQPAFGREVAVKVIDRRLDAMAVTRFRRECLAVGQLGAHPAIVTVFEAGETAQGLPYLLMPFYEGGSLQDRLDRGVAMGWEEACALGVRMGSALAVAHDAGVLHRDIKPANILVGRYGDAVLSDFGIARVADGPETTSGVVTASLAHAPPEILNGGRPTPASDLYSLGSTLYMLIAGHAAFHADTDESLLPQMHRILTAPPPDLGAQVPEPVQAAIRRAMAKDPADRPTGAVALARLIQQAQAAAGAPVSPLIGGAADAHPDPVPVHAPRSGPASTPPTPTPSRLGASAPPTMPVPGLPPVDALDPDPPSGSQPIRRRGRLVVLAAPVVLLIVVATVWVVTRDAGGSVAAGGVPIADLEPVHLPDGIVIDEELRGLGVREPVEGELAAGQAVAYRFAAPEAGWVGLLLQGRTGTIDPFLTLFDRDGDEVYFDDDSGEGRNAHDAAGLLQVDPTAGPFTAVVSSLQAGQQGGYRLRLDVADVHDLPATDDRTFSGRPGDVQAVAYRITPTVGDAAVFTMRSAVLDSYLELYGPEGELLAQDDDAGMGAQGVDARISWTFDREGEHLLIASQFRSDSGAWTLQVDGDL